MTSIRDCKYSYKDQALVTSSIASTFQVFSPMNSKIDELEEIFRPFSLSSAFSLTSPDLFSMTRYLDDDLYCILNMVFKIRTPYLWYCPKAYGRDPRRLGSPTLTREKPI